MMILALALSLVVTAIAGLAIAEVQAAVERKTRGDRR